MSRVSIAHLALHHYRNHSFFECDIPHTGPVVITGPNGSGKTSILESLSLLTAGRGLRGASFAEMVHLPCKEPPIGWTISARILCKSMTHVVGTAYDPLTAKRILRLDDEDLRSHNKLLEWLHILWLVPQMDTLFLENASVRRQFLDHLVSHFYPNHLTFLRTYNRLLRERARLLKMSHLDTDWLNIIEQQMSESAVAITAARVEVINFLQNSMESLGNIPHAVLHLSDPIRRELCEAPALHVERWLQEEWSQSRAQDARSARTALGPHRSDLMVKHGCSQLPARVCSTGEQKALLLTCIIAHIRALMRWRKRTPILLLDEVLIHLDQGHRETLLTTLRELEVQLWLTGTDPEWFQNILGLNSHIIHLPGVASS